ncbi:MAG TPA: dienelactone hydrolase family protein [Methanomicrobiales archaeon]|nr:dienelactone hydrolase family protein [Methanomicrobiales archaeon]
MKPVLPLSGFNAGRVPAVLGKGSVGKQETGVSVQPPPGSLVNISVGERNYPAYFAAPDSPGKHPALVLLHSFKGLEQGYRELADRIAGDGFAVVAPGWQAQGKQPPDPDVAGVIRGSLTYLSRRPEADMNRVGLTGFCAGGRYTMLFLPQMKEFRSGVAWYGFPDRGTSPDGIPASHIARLSVPMLMIHGSRDEASPVKDIYRYATNLDAAGKYFELKVYQGKPHGFMVVGGALARDDAAEDAYREMMAFFQRTLA